MKCNKWINWFTLVEIMIWILIVSMVILWWFQALSSVTIWKAKIIQTVDTQKEVFYFSEKLFEMIKKWWTLDYEEYFNREVIWNSSYLSWHFDKKSWFWNYWNNWTVWTATYWNWFYYCISDNWLPMWLNWCVSDFNTLNSNLQWKQQRYGQYSYQFIDYNSNYYSDGWTPWDEDGDWKIIWDDDDEFIWDWPEVFWSWSFSPELYLISWDKTKRTYFRWTVVPDPNKPSWINCNINSTTNIITWSWCIWTIEYTTLLWKDWGNDHDLANIDANNTQNDWIIDTWIVDPEIALDSVWKEIIAWKSIVWVPLFSEIINVEKFDVYAYPNKNLSYAWKNTDPSVNLSPYIVLKMKIWPSWISKKKLRWTPKTIDFSMTINLSDIYSK